MLSNLKPILSNQQKSHPMHKIRGASENWNLTRSGDSNFVFIFQIHIEHIVIRKYETYHGDFINTEVCFTGINDCDDYTYPYNGVIF